MRDRVGDPADPTLSVGERIKFYRQRRGMSRAVLGGLIGKSARWVKAVETGQLQQPKLPVLVKLAEALKVRDLAQFIGGQPLPMTLFQGPGHPALPAVRDAINAVGVTPDGPPPALDHLESRLGAAWRARHSAPDHRTVLGGLLPDLIRDAKYAMRAYEGAERRRALALLAGAYNLVQFFLAYQPAADLLWRVAERAVMAAEESDDPKAFGDAVWLLAEAHRDAGDFDAAESVTREGLDLLRPRLDDADDNLLGIWGALHFAAAYTAARSGQKGAAWGWWDRAGWVAGRLPEIHYDPMTSFSRTIMDAHAVTVAVELKQGAESIRQAERTAATAIPSQPRRARHLIEVARAYQIGNAGPAALSALTDAYTTAPETIRYNGYARRMIREYAQGSTPALQRDARDLADKVGLLV
ncbi:MAG TPA: helix-turn-helix domain-containing protein [Streptosporangiaceae bacterium]|jgi:transcriptional regulator with XRE-family HTH domain|nr:helix-turn-helix domain-containing protein [Streptosporangiaceae bacterium]